MTVDYPEFVPDPSLTRKEMEALQRDIAAEAVFTDAFSFPASLEDVTVAGVDQAFLGDAVISGIVVMQDGEVVERGHSISETAIPYIPGLLAFREGKPILDTYSQLSVEPDLLVVDGSGRIHFREAGIATHIGVILDVPSIGVAKNLLCGTPEHSLEVKMSQGKRVPIMADNRVETVEDGTVIGYAYQSKQYSSGSRYVNPLYVSPGHRVSAATAVDMVERLGGDYKLPEPTRLADAYVDTVKDDTDQRDLFDY